MISRHTTAHSLLPCEYSAQRGDKNGPRTAYGIQKCGEKNFFRQLILILMAHKTGPSRTEWLLYNPKFWRTKYFRSLRIIFPGAQNAPGTHRIFRRSANAMQCAPWGERSLHACRSSAFSAFSAFAEAPGTHLVLLRKKSTFCFLK